MENEITFRPWDLQIGDFQGNKIVQINYRIATDPDFIIRCEQLGVKQYEKYEKKTE